MTGLKLCSFHADKIRVNASALDEMRRLQSTKELVPKTIQSTLTTSKLTVSYLNVRSLKEHLEDLLQSKAAAKSDVLCLSENESTNLHKIPDQ